MTGNIMIIDDSQVDRKIIRKAIESRYPDVTIYEAENGLDCNKKLLEHHIHVCILDILMPEISGYEVLQELKQSQDTMDIPVIVCTGILDKMAIEHALNLGAYDFFVKPLKEETLKISLPIKVKNAIDLMKRREEIIYLSFHDNLTETYNRRYAEEAMVSLDMEKNLPFALVMGDVNGLKLTNDAFGHEAGDRLLVKIADVLKQECKSDGIVARVGGDEFLILLPKTEYKEALKIISRIKQRCEREQEDPIEPSISFGCGVKKDSKQDIVSVYKEAEDRMYNNKLLESTKTKNSIVTRLINNFNLQNSIPPAHISRLKKLGEQIGLELGLNLEQIDLIKLLVDFHDIGLTAIPEAYAENRMLKNQEELPAYKEHCEIGYRIANSISDLAPIAKDILAHHEKWNGSGYPYGKRQEEIPVKARIMYVLETYDKWLFGDCSVSHEELKEYIMNQAGISFDPVVVESFLRVLNRVSIEKEVDVFSNK